MIKETNFYDGHLKSIEFNYSKTKYFDDYFNRIENIYKKISSNQSLVNLNIELIKIILKYFRFKHSISEIIGFKN